MRTLPRNDRDLFIAANNSHMLAFDNVSGLPFWISDTLCRLATSGGFATRTLHTDQDETLFNARRPIILNGIEDIVTRSDLASRSLFLTLDPILTVLSGGIRRRPNTRLDRLPRMADFALWATACEPELWDKGTFSAAYFRNIAGAVECVIDADPVPCSVRDFMVDRDEWAGTSSSLLVELSRIVPERITKSKSWPDSARGMGGRLRRAAEVLRKAGVDIVFPTSHYHGRVFTITSRLEDKGALPSFSSRPSRVDETYKDINDLGMDGSRDGRRLQDGQDGTPLLPSRLPSRYSPLKNKGNGIIRDGRDGQDGRTPLLSEDDWQEGEIRTPPQSGARAFKLL